MSEINFDDDPLSDSFSDSGLGDPSSTNPGGGIDLNKGEEGGFDEGFQDPGYEQPMAPEYQQEAYAPAGPTEKPPLNVYTVMLFISLISLIIGIISLAIQLNKYGA